jgi:hypothetical protein
LVCIDSRSNWVYNAAQFDVAEELGSSGHLLFLDLNLLLVRFVDDAIGADIGGEIWRSPLFFCTRKRLFRPR